MSPASPAFMIAQEVPLLPPPRPTPVPTLSPRYQLVAWVGDHRVPRETPGHTSTSDSPHASHCYSLLFIDRITGGAVMGKLTHGDYYTREEMERCALRHVRAGFVDADGELGKRAREGWGR